MQSHPPVYRGGLGHLAAVGRWSLLTYVRNLPYCASCSLDAMLSSSTYVAMWDLLLRTKYIFMVSK